MASFESPKFPALRVSGAGKFSDGKLEVDGEAAEKVRRLVGNPAFDITETTPEQKPAPRRGRPRKADSE